jgi:hypothetical protein
MMRALLAILALLAASAHAAPFLQADVPADAAVDGCTLAGLPGAIAPKVAPVAGTLADGSAGRVCRWDLTALPAGSYTVTAKTQASIWGAESAASAPFAFTRPGSLAPSGPPRLVP